MLIQRLDNFFRVHLVLDKPTTLNTISNIALAPLQHLIGHRNYESLQGRVAELPQISNPEAKDAAWKTLLYIIATLFATPIALITRPLSYISSGVSDAFRITLILKANQFQRMSLLRTLPDSMLDAVYDSLKIQEFENYIIFMTDFLQKFVKELQEAGNNKPSIEALLKTKRAQLDYPYPFAFATRLAKLSKDKLPRKYIDSFENLCKACSDKLQQLGMTVSNEEEFQGRYQKLLEKKIQEQTLIVANFFAELRTKIQEPEFSQSLEQKKTDPQFLGPFYLAPKMLEIKKLLSSDSSEVKKFKDDYNFCIEPLRNDELSMDPPQDIKLLLEQIERLKNIMNFHSLFTFDNIKPLPLK